LERKSGERVSRYPATSFTSSSSRSSSTTDSTRSRPAGVCTGASSIRTTTLASRKPAASIRSVAITLSVSGSSLP
jgi:hypothetical protein